MQNIAGKVVYQNLNGGFYGIVSDDGAEYLPINMPEQLKHPGQRVSVKVKKVNVDTMFMWGTAVKILSFHTITPN